MALTKEEMSRAQGCLRKIFSTASGVIGDLTEAREDSLTVLLSRGLPDEKKQEISGQIENAVGRKLKADELKFVNIGKIVS